MVVVKCGMYFILCICITYLVLYALKWLLDKYFYYRLKKQIENPIFLYTIKERGKTNNGRSKSKRSKDNTTNRES